eukprot:jgi/Ulvmu1/3094/UM015_0134.1
MQSSPLRPQGMGSFASWRLELFFKNRKQLADLTQFLSGHRITRVNITNKRKTDNLVDWNEIVADVGVPVDTCVHWSIKQNYQGAAEKTHAALKAFCEQLTSGEGHSKHDVLLVSGGGPKRAYNTVSALRKIAAESESQACRHNIEWHVAYNPYFPQEAEQRQESQRLHDKLRSGLVHGVWLQMGGDADRLEAALTLIEAAFDMHCSHQRPKLYGSIFVPTKQLLAQMRFRPWSGVYLSDEYLDTLEGAHKITHTILQQYYNAGVVPLVESKITSTEELRKVEKMLESAAGEEEGLLEGMRHSAAPARKRNVRKKSDDAARDVGDTKVIGEGSTRKCKKRA